MWNTQNTFNADLATAMRMVLTGHASPDQAATACGVSVADIQAILRSCPQLQLQEVEHSRQPSAGAAAWRYLASSHTARRRTGRKHG